MAIALIGLPKMLPVLIAESALGEALFEKIHEVPLPLPLEPWATDPFYSQQLELVEGRLSEVHESIRDLKSKPQPFSFLPKSWMDALNRLRLGLVGPNDDEMKIQGLEETIPHLESLIVRFNASIKAQMMEVEQFKASVTKRKAYEDAIEERLNLVWGLLVLGCWIISASIRYIPSLIEDLYHSLCLVIKLATFVLEMIKAISSQSRAAGSGICGGLLNWILKPKEMVRFSSFFRYCSSFFKQKSEVLINESEREKERKKVREQIKEKIRIQKLAQKSKKNEVRT